MPKKYIVRLTDDERAELDVVIKRLKCSAQKSKRANILLMADADGPAWKDAQIAAAYHCRVQTIENLRERFVTEGFAVALQGKLGTRPPRNKVLDGQQEAQVIAMRLGSPPAGYVHWTLRLLTDRVIALEIVPTISHETVRRTLKKTA